MPSSQYISFNSSLPINCTVSTCMHIPMYYHPYIDSTTVLSDTHATARRSRCTAPPCMQESCIIPTPLNAGWLWSVTGSDSYSAPPNERRNDGRKQSRSNWKWLLNGTTADNFRNGARANFGRSMSSRNNQLTALTNYWIATVRGLGRKPCLKHVVMSA